MDQTKKDALVAGGINVDNALERFMGNEAMLIKYLGKFMADKSYTALTAAMQADDKESAAMAAHTLKSTSGTIGCDAMRDLVIAQEAAIKAGDWEKAKSMVPQVNAEYERVCAIIKQVTG